MKNKFKLSLIATACLIWSTANAGQATASFTVRATLQANCTVMAQDMVFGDISLDVGADAVSTINIECPVPTNVYVKLNGGDNEESSQKRLKQTVGSNDYFLNYKLYSDQSKTQEFLTGYSIPFGGVAFTAGELDTAVNVYGEIPVQDSKPSGLYSDMIQVSVDY